MLFSRSAEYALRATALLALHPPGTLIMANRIAAEANMPAQFLAKLLQLLAKGGLLRSVKGPHGGFGLTRPAREIRLADVLFGLDPEGLERHCPLGQSPCEAPGCGMHIGWEAIHSRIVEYLERTTLADISPRPVTVRESGSQS